jgi:hypothetical protein
VTRGRVLLRRARLRPSATRSFEAYSLTSCSGRSSPRRVRLAATVTGSRAWPSSSVRPWPACPAAVGAVVARTAVATVIRAAVGRVPCGSRGDHGAYARGHRAGYARSRLAQPFARRSSGVRAWPSCSVRPCRACHAVLAALAWGTPVATVPGAPVTWVRCGSRGARDRYARGHRARCAPGPHGVRPSPPTWRVLLRRSCSARPSAW